jgi:hypothetical protein
LVQNILSGNDPELDPLTGATTGMASKVEHPRAGSFKNSSYPLIPSAVLALVAIYRFKPILPAASPLKRVQNSLLAHFRSCVKSWPLQPDNIPAPPLAGSIVRQAEYRATGQPLGHVASLPL